MKHERFTVNMKGGRKTFTDPTSTTWRDNGILVITTKEDGVYTFPAYNVLFTEAYMFDDKAVV